MNNSRVAIENLEEIEDNRLSFLQKKQGELTQLIEIINRVAVSEDWQKLRDLVLNDVVVTLERKLKLEAENIDVHLPKLYRLQGNLEWARKYLDLGKLVEWKKTELESIKNLIKHESNPRDGAL